MQLLSGSYVLQLEAAAPPPSAPAAPEVLAGALPEEALLIRQAEGELAVLVVVMVLPEVLEQVQLLPEPGKVLQQGRLEKLTVRYTLAAVPAHHFPLEVLTPPLVVVPGAAVEEAIEYHIIRHLMFRQDSRVHQEQAAVAVEGLIIQVHHRNMRGVAKRVQAVLASV